MFRIMQYLGNLVVLLLGLCLAWILSTAVFFVVTGGGSVYDSISTVARQCDSAGKVDETRYFASCSSSGPELMQLTIYHENDPLVFLEVQATGRSLELRWEHAYTSWPRLSEYLGMGRRRGALQVFTLSDSWSFTPYARDISVNVPAGAIAPQVKQLLTQSRDAAEIDMSDVTRDTLADRIADEIMAAANWGAMSENVNSVSLIDGRIQFVTLFVFFVACISLVAGVDLPWSRSLGSGVLQLILYVGFFGTLAGMSGALEVLGSADLTNPLSKGTRLGPIGSQIALAINTTMYAVILFGAALLLDFWLRSIVEEELEASQTRINRKVARAVAGVRRLWEKLFATANKDPA
ncbi:MAG: hypothetical protein AB7I50_17430 [Vicinamibacterales bacterium]